MFLTEKNKISAILLNWERSENIRLIMKNLIANRLIAEIILWNNNSSAPLLYAHPKLKIINSPKNFFTSARYTAATLAEHETIFFQDDDFLLEESQIETLYGAYKKDPSRIYGCFGRNIENGQYITKDVFGEVDIIMDGMMLFHKSLLHNFFRLITELKINPGMMVEADILFSLSIKRKHFAVDVGGIKKLPDPFSISSRKDHFEQRQAMVNLCLSRIRGKCTD